MTSLFPVLPVFLDLVGRSAVLLSAEESMAPLARQLLESGASVTVFDAAPSEAIEALCPPARLVRRAWRTTDMRAAALVAAGPRERRARRAQIAARAAHAIFLMLDGPGVSEVVYGETAARGPLALALAAPGVPSALNQALLHHLESAAPLHLAGLFEAAARSGARADDAVFWRNALAAALTERPADWAAWLTARLEAES